MADERGTVETGLLAVWQFVYGSSGTDGYHVYGPEGDRTVQIWNIRTGEPWTKLGGHDAPVRFVELSTDGRLVATVDANANLKLWRLELPKD
jgi:WD40 repeat protein